jgi:cytochrome c biogenesis protein ResB
VPIQSEPHRPWRAARDFLRKPALIIGEVAAISVASAVSTTLPQDNEVEELGRFAARSPGLARVTAALGLHGIIGSPWFLACVGLALLSLVVVQADQWRRLRRTWGSRLVPADLGRAQYRRELPVPPGKAAGLPVLRRAGRLGLLGSPLFHAGLLTVVFAGTIRLLYFADAGAKLVEGDTLPDGPAGWHQFRRGPLAGPFALPRGLRLEEVLLSYYPSGPLKQVAGRFVLLGPPQDEEREVAINSPLDLGSSSVYVLLSYGKVASLVHRTGSGEELLTIWLDPADKEWRGGQRLGGDREVRVRATRGEVDPERVEVRVSNGAVLAAVAQMQLGNPVAIGPGESLELGRVAGWVSLRGSRDPSRPLFFAGIVVAITGILLLFGFVPVETGAFVQGGRLVVALRAQRFAPLYAEQFEQLVKEFTS